MVNETSRRSGCNAEMSQSPMFAEQILVHRSSNTLVFIECSNGEHSMLIRRPEIGRRVKLTVNTKLHWPIFSSYIGKWSQERAYEPILVSQIAPCANYDVQIDACSIHRTSAYFGFPERVLFRSWRATACERCL